MKKRSEMADDARPEYDVQKLLKGGIGGKYVRPYRQGTNLVLPYGNPA